MQRSAKSVKFNLETDRDTKPQKRVFLQ